MIKSMLITEMALPVKCQIQQHLGFGGFNFYNSDLPKFLPTAFSMLNAE